MQPTLHVLGHLDLGDCFVMNGLIRSLVKATQPVVWYVRDCYVPEVTCMMRDLNRLTIRPAAGGYEDHTASWLNEPNMLKLGCFGPRFDWAHWDFEMYRQAKVPFENRWTRFRHAVWKDRYRFTPEPKRVFAHERADTGAVLHRNLWPEDSYVVWVNNVPGRTAEQWVREEALRASEIHVVDSAFLCILDSLAWPATGVKFVFHAYAKKYRGGNWPVCWPALRNPWTIIA